MKIITYNIWNHQRDFNERMELLVEVLKKENADIIALQEVRNEKLIKFLVMELEYSSYSWVKYHDDEEGLAIISKYDLDFTWTNISDSVDYHNSGIISCKINYKDNTIGISNLHLDYKSALNREVELVKGIKQIESFENDYDLLMGDFNTYPNSSIHSYLSGGMTLHNHATNWIDLHESFTYPNNSDVTLDFKNNPRWDNEVDLSKPARFDWILLKGPYPKKSPRLLNCKLIGNKRVDNITPSDHYGVLVELDI